MQTSGRISAQMRLDIRASEKRRPFLQVVGEYLCASVYPYTLFNRICVHLCNAPENPVSLEKYGESNNKYRYIIRHPKNEDELNYFSQFSEENFEIAHLDDIRPINRNRLYKLWFDEGKQARMFAILEEANEDGTEPLPIACSILIPLTESGRIKLAEDGMAGRDLLPVDIAKDNLFSHLLIDTWAARKEYRGKSPYIKSLLLKHLQVMCPAGLHPLTVWVEPAHPTLCKIIHARFSRISAAVPGEYTYKLDVNPIIASIPEVQDINMRNEYHKFIASFGQLVDKIKRMSDYPLS